jgi:hypothetical protein
VFLKRFGLRWSGEEIPHLNPLPLRKGEARRARPSIGFALSDSASPIGERIEVRGNPLPTLSEAAWEMAEIYLEFGSWRIGVFD